MNADLVPYELLSPRARTSIVRKTRYELAMLKDHDTIADCYVCGEPCKKGLEYPDVEVHLWVEAGTLVWHVACDTPVFAAQRQQFEQAYHQRAAEQGRGRRRAGARPALGPAGDAYATEDAEG